MGQLSLDNLPDHPPAPDSGRAQTGRNGRTTATGLVMSTVDRLSGHRGSAGCLGQPAGGQCGRRGRSGWRTGRRTATGSWTEFATAGADPRTAPPLPSNRPRRLPSTAGHGIFLPTGGLRQRWPPPDGIRRPGRNVLCVCPDGQGLRKDAVWDLRKFLPTGGEVRAGC